jgi:hypothetical protein
MNENVLAAIVGLDKAEALLPVEPLHSTCRHVTISVSRTQITNQADDRLACVGRRWEANPSGNHNPY